MPSLHRLYQRTVFGADVLRAAYERYASLLPHGSSPAMSMREVSTGRDRWTYDTNEEFLAAIGEPHDYSYVIFCVGNTSTGYHNARVVVERNGSKHAVTVDGDNRGHVLGMMEPFESNAERCRVAEPPKSVVGPPTVFMAHGRTDSWKTIRDELRKHGYPVEAYEEAARSGLTITDVLGRMFGKSAFGVAVLTAEDEQAAGGLRARQNVIHETGYLHGSLGVSKVAILMESGVEQFTNIAGVQYIGFPAGQPIVAMSDLLAHLRREFA